MSSFVADIVRQRLASAIKWVLLLVLLGWLFRRRPAEHRVRYEFSLILPGMLVAAVIGVFLWIETGQGTEMTPILYLVLAAPWSALFGSVAASGELAWTSIVGGWLINGLLLFALGFWIDYGLWLRRRRAVSKG